MSRPIRFPQKISNPKVQKIYNSISKKAKDSGSLVNGITSIEFIEMKNQIHWKIDTLSQKQVDIIGPFFVITQKQVDNYIK